MSRDAERLGWVLLVIGIGVIVAGVFLTGKTDDVSLLLIVGMGATTVGLALHGEMTPGTETDAETEPEESP